MIDYKNFELYKKDSIDKQLKITFNGGVITNSEIPSEQFELTESLSSDSQLMFGSCEASEIKFRIYNVFLPLKDKWLTVTQTLNGDTSSTLQIGKYKVYSDKPTANRRYRDVVAYDQMYDIINADLTEWYNSLFPTDSTTVTLKEFRTSLMNYLGVEQEDVTLVNDDMVIEKTIQPTQLAGRDVVSAICEINGCFGHIGRDGKFHYVFLAKRIQGLYPANDLYPQDNLFPREQVTNKIDKSLYIDCQYEDYLSQEITKLQIRQEENDIGKTYPGGETTELDNTYVVQGNFLVYGKEETELEDIAKKLFSVISGTEYRPYEAQVVGNPCFEVGDAIRFNTSYQIVESYILKRTLTGVQGLRDELSADGEEYLSENAGGIESQIQQLKGKSNVLERNINETISQISDVEQGLQTEIKQTTSSFAQTVSATQNKWDTSNYSDKNIYIGYEDVTNVEVTPKQMDYDLFLDSNTGILYEKYVSGVVEGGGETYSWRPLTHLSTVKDNLSSRIDQTLKSISLEINNGDKTAGIVITLENEDGTTTTLPEAKIEMTGIVTFNDLEGNSQTVINGDYITTGTIDAEKVNVENINADNITSGTIDADEINVINVVAESVAAENITGKTFCLDSKEIIRNDFNATSYGEENDICLFGREDIKNAIYGWLYCVVSSDELLYPVILCAPYDPGEGYSKVRITYLHMIGGTGETDVPYLQIDTNNGISYGVDVWRSDTKLKKNIKQTDIKALNKIKEIEFIQFDWKSNNSHTELGVSANQLEKIMPESVFSVKQSAENTEIKHINNSVVTTYALKAIQEQQEIIESQQKEIDELKKSVSFLMQKIGGGADE